MTDSTIRKFFRLAAHILILRPLVRLYAGVDIDGRENIDQLQHYLIIANHNSHLDILLLYCLVPLRQITRTHPVAELRYFSRSRVIFAMVNFLFQPIWIERGHPDIADDPFRIIKEKIESGHNIIIFPEGTRGEPGQLQPFKSGIGRLLQQYPDLPVVTVLLAGPERVLPRKSMLPLPFWNKVVVGPPVFYRGEHRQITRSLEETLRSLAETEKIVRHRRKSARYREPRIIAFLGIDGSGKSTTSRSIARHLSFGASVCLVTDTLELFHKGEAHDVQPMITEKLRQAVGGWAKNVASLKSYKIPKITELMLRDHMTTLVKRWYHPQYIVLDGSPLLNMTAWAVLYHKETIDRIACSKILSIMSGHDKDIPSNDSVYTQLPDLQQLKRLNLSRMSMPHAVALIDVVPDEACRRIGTRGEQQQVHETAPMLDELRQAYHMVIDIIRDDLHIPSAIIDGQRPVDEVAAEAIEFLNQTWSIEHDNE
ncbi:MAG: 1-acyl-sn-glycerol-3-phosphate acyltransferase [Candidatus Fermentibacteraceae bacterium]|nr:1-acyl-sn-glycerol-3-phosphate acyltransferase [Candidatus Fermentibacteraceae bacterium]